MIRNYCHYPLPIVIIRYQLSSPSPSVPAAATSHESDTQLEKENLDSFPGDRALACCLSIIELLITVVATISCCYGYLHLL